MPCILLPAHLKAIAGSATPLMPALAECINAGCLRSKGLGERTKPVLV
jgi:hypothetical protein